MTPLDSMARAAGLRVAGTLDLTSDDGLPGLHGLALISPDEPAFWPLFQTSPEAQDGAPHPLNRWSDRVIGALATDTGGTAIFPFGGPPHHPFYAWALRSGAVWASPVALLVDATMGLFTSFRGAIAYADALPARMGQNPCPTCAAPCTTACPAGALTPRGYDVAACRAYLATAAGADCHDGCLVRRACPVGTRRLPAQSRFHMQDFMA